jgi:hypothetical protein
MDQVGQLEEMYDNSKKILAGAGTQTAGLGLVDIPGVPATGLIKCNRRI